MRSTTLSKFEVNLTHQYINLGIVTEAAAKFGVKTIVSIPEHINTLVVQRGMMRSTHKIMCALDLEGKHFGFDKLSRIRSDITGANGFEITLSQGRSSIELLNEIKVIHQFLRNNNPLVEICWVLNVSKRDPKEVVSILQHLAQYPPNAIRIDRAILPGNAIDAYITAIKNIRQLNHTPIKIDGSSSEVVQAFIGNLDVVAFDIAHDNIAKMAQLVETIHTTQPSALTPITNMTVNDLQKELACLSKHEAPISQEQLLLYIQRCQALGTTAGDLQKEFGALRDKLVKTPELVEIKPNEIP